MLYLAIRSFSIERTFYLVFSRQVRGFSAEDPAKRAGLDRLNWISYFGVLSR